MGQGTDVGGAELLDTVLELAEADEALAEDAKYLVLAALEGDASLGEALDGVRPLPATAQTEAEQPVGAYLRSVSVQGFRGVGPTAVLWLQPGPGLTVVAGRNGSGKSTFAEALEMALTGNSYRWKTKQSVLWREGWRNLHAGQPCEIRVQLAEEGAGPTTVCVTWPDGADLGDLQTWVQRPGRPRESGLGALGWTRALELYRPILSYDELAGILEAEPSKLYDALQAILGLELVTDAQRRLDSVRKDLGGPRKTADETKRRLLPQLERSTDGRAVIARELLRRRRPSLDEAQRLAAGAGTDNASALAPLRAAAALAVPSEAEVRAAADELTSALAEVAATGAGLDALAVQQAELLRSALSLHAEHGDQTCPVCGTGSLDGAWRARAERELAAGDAALASARQARSTLDAARRAVRQLVATVADVPAGLDRFALASTAEAADALSAWRLAADEDVPAARAVLADAFTGLQREAGTALVRLEDAWTPLAAQLAQWSQEETVARDNEPRLAVAKQAATWLKANAEVLRVQRLAPLADDARGIWAALRQESNVDLGVISLRSANTRRAVELTATVDDVPAGALAVMSQGELHALALALFLPRATMQASPFRFLVLDDPVQAMDPAKVDGLVRVLADAAADRQVIVLSHDDRLPEAVRRLVPDARLVEIHRGALSCVRIAETTAPADRYLDDALALAKDDAVPDTVKRRVLPGLCRSALEMASRDIFMARRLGRGDDRAATEDAWEGAKRVIARLGLALRDDPATDAPAGWLADRPYRRAAARLCNRDVHLGFDGDLLTAVRDVRRTIAELREKAKR